MVPSWLVSKRPRSPRSPRSRPISSESHAEPPVTPIRPSLRDFLDAPGKMVEAVKSPAVSLFVRSYEKAGHLSLDMLGFGASYGVRRLARFVGSDFLNDIAEFLTRLSGLLDGLPPRFTASGRLKAFPHELSRTRLAALASGDPATDRDALTNVRTYA